MYYLIFSLLLFLGSCRPEQGMQTVFFNFQQTEKPILALVPVIDNSGNQGQWSLSDELTESIYHSIAKRHRIALRDLGRVRKDVSTLTNDHNPFGLDISWVKMAFPGDDFVCFMELLKHDTADDLDMTMRVRVLDLRGDTPRIVLQELVDETYEMPRILKSRGFTQVAWGHQTYDISPLGSAHKHMSGEIAEQVEEYILQAR